MIALPTFFCPKLWEDMTGNETERFCSKCQKTVHNIESLTLDQRLALLSSPQGSICGRYRIAVCRARPGYERPYMQHLLKYGAGVAVASAAFITLWQLYDDSHRPTPSPRFRVGTESTGCGGLMPEPFYDEHSTPTLGIMIAPESPLPEIEVIEGSRPSPSLVAVDISLEPVALEKLLQASERPKLNFPELTPSKAP